MEKGEIVLIGLVVLTFIGFAGGAVIMQQQMKHMPMESCAQMCHEMHEYYVSFIESEHAKEIHDCHECHESHEDMIGEMLMYGKEMVKHMEIQYHKMHGGEVEKIEQKPPSSPENEVCMKCHETGEKGAPIVSEEISPNGTTCITCHLTIPHEEHPIGEYGKPDSKYRGYESPVYEGRECVACHSDHSMVVTEDTCVSCHRHY
ncbi:MAG: NapC/NirT family cytochrome c [Canidatus Methanoxibalbensis ujae]|nr:NapC/NirT family cytochrome c [Candidatus Methanoxibalbensis ujae]MCW7078269.1 NapC/NirT family cytochrome c [Candidatus Methanoxibalbensis ujae]